VSTGKKINSIPAETRRASHSWDEPTASTGDSPSEGVGSAVVTLPGGGQGCSSVPAQWRRSWALWVAWGAAGEHRAWLASWPLQRAQQLPGHILECLAKPFLGCLQHGKPQLKASACTERHRAFGFSSQPADTTPAQCGSWRGVDQLAPTSPAQAAGISQPPPALLALSREFLILNAGVRSWLPTGTGARLRCCKQGRG